MVTANCQNLPRGGGVSKACRAVFPWTLVDQQTPEQRLFPEVTPDIREAVASNLRARALASPSQPNPLSWAASGPGLLSSIHLGGGGW